MRNATHTSRRAAAGLLAALTVGTALDGPLLGAGEIRMAIEGGRVTLSATEAPLANVPAETAVRGWPVAGVVLLLAGAAPSRR